MKANRYGLPFTVVDSFLKPGDIFLLDWSKRLSFEQQVNGTRPSRPSWRFYRQENDKNLYVMTINVSDKALFIVVSGPWCDTSVSAAFYDVFSGYHGLCTLIIAYPFKLIGPIVKHGDVHEPRLEVQPISSFPGLQRLDK